MEADGALYERAMCRVHRYIVYATVAGAIAAVALRGWTSGALFLLGAAGGYFTFSWLHQIVEGLGPDARPTRKRVIVLFLLRYAIFGAVACVIVKFFGVNAIAAVFGLFTPVAAILLEILYELVHGTGT